MKGMYTTGDSLKFSKPEPAPCPAWGIRLSRSNIIYGSTKEGNQLRRTVSPWFTGINEDYKSLENSDCIVVGIGLHCLLVGSGFQGP
jgi:hypothetical protein